MRDIKFRAWDSEKSTWIYVSLGDLVCGATSKPSVFLGENYKLADGDLSTEGSFLNWSQYTGLKDKNGTEIYEGDIVKSLREHFKGYVFWNEHCGGWMVQEVGSNVDAGVYDGDIAKETTWSLASVLEYEVIGNIYESPELLEGSEQNEMVEISKQTRIDIGALSRIFDEIIEAVESRIPFNSKKGDSFSNGMQHALNLMLEKMREWH